MDIQQKLEKGKEAVALRINLLAPEHDTGIVLDGYHSQDIEVTLCYIQDEYNANDRSIKRAGFYHNYYGVKNQYADIVFKVSQNVLDNKQRLSHSFHVSTFADLQDASELAVKAKSALALRKKFDALCKKMGYPTTAEQYVSFFAAVVKASNFFINDQSTPENERLYFSPGEVHSIIDRKIKTFLDRALQKDAA